MKRVVNVFNWLLVFTLILLAWPENAAKAKAVTRPNPYGTIWECNCTASNIANNLDNVQVYNVGLPGTGTYKMIRVHFEWIDMERYYDYIKTSAGDKWSGSMKDVWSSWAYDDNISVYVDTDGSNQSGGYKIDRVEYYYDIDISQTWKTYVPYELSDWNNTGTRKNAEASYTITAPSSAKAIRVYFSELDTELNYDKIRLNSNNQPSKLYEELHGSRSGVWSSWYKGNVMNIKFKTDGSTDSKGFKIYGYEYANTYDFPGCENNQFPLIPTVNPHHGDGQRRLAERMNYLPDSGNISFGEVNTETYFPNATSIGTGKLRKYRLEFSWSASRLRNLQVDGNDAIEMQVDFFNGGINGTDPAGRPHSSFYGWMTPFKADQDPSNSNTGGYNEYYDQKLYYYYKTNLPSSAYPDTFYSSNTAPGKGTYSFAVGIYDTQQLKADTKYYYEILADRGRDASGNIVQKGIFSLSGQRGYRYECTALQILVNNMSPAYLVFSEENEDRTMDGENIIGLTNEWYNTDPLSSGKYFNLNDIICMRDSRTSPNLMAQSGSTFRWNKYGDIYGKYGNNTSETFMSITRLWNSWNTDAMNGLSRVH